MRRPRIIISALLVRIVTIAIGRRFNAALRRSVIAAQIKFTDSNPNPNSETTKRVVQATKTHSAEVPDERFVVAAGINPQSQVDLFERAIPSRSYLIRLFSTPLLCALCDLCDLCG